MKRQWTSVLLIILVLIVAVFSVLNVDPVNINFGFRMVEIPLVIVIIGALLIGLIIAAVLSTTIILGERNEMKKLRQEMTELEQENHAASERLINQHQEEVRDLEAEHEKSQAEIRDLKRRIQNMQISQTGHHKNNHTNNV